MSNQSLVSQNRRKEDKAQAYFSREQSRRRSGTLVSLGEVTFTAQAMTLVVVLMRRQMPISAISEAKRSATEKEIEIETVRRGHEAKLQKIYIQLLFPCPCGSYSLSSRNAAPNCQDPRTRDRTRSCTDSTVLRKSPYKQMVFDNYYGNFIYVASRKPKSPFRVF